MIRRKVGQAVSIEQMINHGHFASKINDYWKNYNEFLLWIGEKEKLIPTSFTEKDDKRKKFLEEKLANCSKNEPMAPQCRAFMNPFPISSGLKGNLAVSLSSKRSNLIPKKSIKGILSTTSYSI